MKKDANKAGKKPATRSKAKAVSKPYTVAGLNMKGTEAPSPLLKRLLQDEQAYVPSQPADPSPGVTPEQMRSVIQAELVARSAGELVQKAMDSQQVSLRELASRLGVVNSRVAEIRKSGQAIEVQTLARYAEALGYDLEIAFVSKTGERLVAK
jgi:ribosome-binding protein aMBF1 (putative translation factor)